jgi:deoxyribodipyrimidine photo-lyase
MSTSGIVILLFHRDLRIADHRALEKAIDIARRTDTHILPLFVFTHEQITRNPLKSAPAVQFMCDSLADLGNAIQERGGKLRLALGNTVEVLKSIKNVVAVVETKDYTPYAKEREAKIRQFCEGIGALYEAVEDIYLTNPGTVLTGSGKTFQKFTPFWTSAKRHTVPKPTGIPTRIPWVTGSPRIAGTVRLSEMQGPRLPEVQPGGRTVGLKHLEAIPRNYSETHDQLGAPTSQLSAHNHFGTVSIREVFWATSQEDFRRQLYWRDFYGHIMAAFEDLYGVTAYEFQKPTSWRKGEQEVFEAWSKGQTGVPLIDAAMHQLLRTGFMHNRARMVVASWLVKDKGVHWRWGERFFAKHLVDYDPAQNMMNWIWIASVLPFASAPFRRHDPERYAERFDKSGAYREKWLED